MKELRNQYYAEIEALTQELIKFEFDNYGGSNDPEYLKISDKIDELEEKIGETWSY